MIVKSTSRKDTGFQQIVDYLHKESFEGRGAFTYVHNIDIDPDDQEAMIEAFRYNDSFRKKRKNGVAFYHEILSFSPNDSATIKDNLDMLRDLTEQYILLRSPNALAIARPHIEEDHIHIHCIISASERESSRTVRISKSMLEEIKKQVRAYQQQHYPELLYSYQKGKDVHSEKTKSHATWQMELNGRKQDKKEQLKNLVIDVLQLSDSFNEALVLLKERGIGIYRRKEKFVGIIWNNRKYRFSTLIRDEKERQQIQQSLNPEIYGHASNPMEDYLQRIGMQSTSSKWQQIQYDLERMENQRKDLSSDRIKDIEKEIL